MQPFGLPLNLLAGISQLLFSRGQRSAELIEFTRELADFIERRALPGTGIEEDAFWAGAAAIFAEFAPQNAKLLEKRDLIQAEIDGWHAQRAGEPIDQPEYQQFLKSIGYLVDEPSPFHVATRDRKSTRLNSSHT